MGRLAGRAGRAARQARCGPTMRALLPALRCRGRCFFHSQEFSFSGSFFEFVRFGKLGGGYGGETFTYPFLNGLLRLTLLPNKGLLWYAPLSVLAVPGFLLLRRRDARLAFALAASALALLFASSAWWAWDGQAGWGPRLVLPALPCLVALAGARARGRRPCLARLAGALALAAGVCRERARRARAVPAVYALSSLVPPQPIADSRAAGTPYEIDRAPDGTLRATAPHHLSLTPAWSPIRVHALVLAARLKGGWDGSLPQLDPPFRPAPSPEPAPALRLARESRPRPGSLRARRRSRASADPYLDALRDQLVRAIDMKDFARADAMGQELERREEKISANDPRTVALVAESLRLRSGASVSLSYLSKKSSSFSSSALSSSSFACHPWILFVRAMAQPPGRLRVPARGAARDLRGCRRGRASARLDAHGVEPGADDGAAVAGLRRSRR